MLQRLPANVLEKICTKLSWSDILSIEQVCFHLRKFVRNEYWPYLSKFQLKPPIKEKFEKSLDQTLACCVRLRELILCYTKVVCHEIKGYSFNLYKTESLMCNESLRAMFISKSLVAGILHNLHSLNISGIPLSDNGAFFRIIGNTIGKNLRILKMNGCYRDASIKNDQKIDQENVDIFMQKCQNLEEFDISHSFNAFGEISFERLATKNLYQFHISYTDICEYKLCKQIFDKYAHCLKGISFHIYQQKIDRSNFRDALTNMKNLRTLTIYITGPSNFLLFNEWIEKGNNNMVKVEENISKFIIKKPMFKQTLEEFWLAGNGFCNDKSMNSFLSPPAMVNLQLLHLYGTDADEKILKNIASMRSLKKLDLLNCTNLTDEVCHSIAEGEMANLKEISILLCPKVSDHGFCHFLNLIKLSLRRIEGGEHLTALLHSELENTLNTMIKNGLLPSLPICSNDERIIEFVRRNEQISMKRGPFTNKHLCQTRTQNIHPWICFYVILE